MKDSSLLKWAQNNNKLNKGGRKDDKKKSWIHPAESLTQGHVAYLVKFLGSTEVDKPKGIEVVKDGIRKLKFSQQIKKAEGTKTPKVELTVSVDGVAIQEPKSKKIQHQYPLHRISYCADDKAEKRFFSFIAKEEDDDKHTCFVFVSDKLAEEITLTIGQAFDLAYKAYVNGDSQNNKSTTAEEENSILKERLREISSLLTPTQLNNFLDKHNISSVCEVKDADTKSNSVKAMSIDTSQASVDSEVAPPTPVNDQLINLDAPVSKFDNMTLDDLNDDDFDPRAGDSDSSDDFNPRNNFQSPVIQTNQSFGSPIQNLGTPQSAGRTPNQTVQSAVVGTPNQTAAAAQILLSPPALPPRDLAKGAPQQQQGNNPFGNAGGGSFGSQDPFGMPTWNAPGNKNVSADLFASLDPLKK